MAGVQGSVTAEPEEADTTGAAQGVCRPAAYVANASPLTRPHDSAGPRRRTARAERGRRGRAKAAAAGHAEGRRGRRLAERGRAGRAKGRRPERGRGRRAAKAAERGRRGLRGAEAAGRRGRAKGRLRASSGGFFNMSTHGERRLRVGSGAGKEMRKALLWLSAGSRCCAAARTAQGAARAPSRLRAGAHACIPGVLTAHACPVPAPPC